MVSLKTEFCSFTASGRGNILARTDATLETLKPHKFGPGSKRQRLTDFSNSTENTPTQCQFMGVLFVYIIIRISVKKALRRACPVFHLNVCSFFCAFFDTGFKHFTFTNIFIFLVSSWYIKILPFGEN